MTKLMKEILVVARRFDSSATLTAKRGHARLVVKNKKFSVSSTPKNKETTLKKVERDLRKYL